MEPALAYADVVDLPVTWSGRPPGANVDLNGHLNHLAYLELGTASCRPLLHGYLGFGPAYVAGRRLTTFVVDQHIGYLAEVRARETMSMHTVLHRFSPRSLTARSYLLNRDTERTAAIMDMTVVHIDVATRRAVPFPDDVRDRVERAHDDLAGALATLPRSLAWYVAHDDSGRPT